MNAPRRHSGFSLVEVVLAVAIIAVGVTAVLELLPALGRQSRAAAETQTALRLTDAVRVELARRAAGNFSGFAGSIPVMAADPTVGLQLAAARDGSFLHWLPADPATARDQYFLLTVRRFPQPSLAFDPAADFLAVEVLVAWPYRVLTPAGLLDPTNSRDRETVSFNLALNR